MDREKLIETYAQREVDSWDMNTLYEFAFDKLYDQIEKLSDDELIDEIKMYFPDILENE